MKIEQVTDWADVAMRTGPFFFALFLFYLTMRFSRSASQGSTPAQQKMWPFFSVSSYVLAAATMVFALIWWFKRPSIHVYEGSLRNLYAYEEVRSDEKGFFLRDEVNQRFPGEEDEFHDIRFVVVRDRPFTDGDAFDIYYRKKKGPRETLRIPYTFGDAAFNVVWDESAARNVLRNCSNGASKAPKGAWLPSLIRSAYAAELPPQLQVDRVASFAPAMPAPPAHRDSPVKAGSSQHVQEQRQPGPILNPDAKDLVTVLQDSRSEVGEKIAALDDINRYDDSGISNLMKATTDEGPVAATFLDLSRHSDPELASKSRRVLGRYDLQGYLVRQIPSSPPSKRDAYEKILSAMNPDAAKAVLAQLPPAVRASVRPSGQDQPLPTGTASGDRYYVKVAWDRQNASTVDCLTKTFNTTLVAHRTLAQEASLMRNRKDRLVYAYDRGWAISLSAAVEKCGAQATYVVPWKS